MKVSRRWFVSAAAMTAFVRPAISLPGNSPPPDLTFPEDLALARSGAMSIRDSIKLAFRYERWRQSYDGMLHIAQHGDPYAGCHENEVAAAESFYERGFDGWNPDWKEPVVWVPHWPEVDPGVTYGGLK
jgi:hypothetical protein